MAAPRISPVTTRNKKPTKAAASASTSTGVAGSIANAPQRLQRILPLVPSAIPAHAPTGDPPPYSRGLVAGPRLSLERKLTIGSASDPLETEADNMADWILRGVPAHVAQTGETVVHSKCACEGSGAECTSCAEKKKLMSRIGGAVAPSEAPSIVQAVINLPGQPLDSDARADFERRFGHDFSGVRIHTDPLAAQSAQALNALAYTVGQKIVFGPGKYAPTTPQGQHLLAHELTHVIQQGDANPLTASTLSISHPADPAERAADVAAHRVMAGFPTALALTSFPVVRAIQRQGQPQSHSTTALDATAQSIIRGAADTSRDPGVRAVESVWRIIKEYYSGKASNVNVVVYDNAQARTGLATAPYPASKPTSGKIFVGDSFLRGVQDPRSFAHHVLQVGHELEHIDQYRDPALGPSAAKKDEREFLAFYHEALATEVPHTGRFQHSNRITVIDAALGYYSCLASAAEQDKKDAAKRYESKQKELLTRRSAEIDEMKNKGYTNVPNDSPPTGCKRQ
jgi:hypothetical protein